MDKEVMDWINTAETDFGVAEHLFAKYYPKPLEISAIIANKQQKKL